MKRTVVLALLTLTGCVSVTDPVPIGKDSYYISASGEGGPVTQGRKMSGAIKAANKFCQSQGKKMMVDRSDIAYGSSEVYFLCVDADQYEKVHMKPDANVRIENSK